MALQHIEDGEYKQAFAILDDFKADIDAERLLNKLDKLVVLDQKLLATQGGLQDKATHLNIRALDRQKDRFWMLDYVMVALNFLLFFTMLIVFKKSPIPMNLNMSILCLVMDMVLWLNFAAYVKIRKIYVIGWILFMNIMMYLLLIITFFSIAQD